MSPSFAILVKVVTRRGSSISVTEKCLSACKGEFTWTGPALIEQSPVSPSSIMVQISGIIPFEACMWIQ